MGPDGIQRKRREGEGTGKRPVAAEARKAREALVRAATIIANGRRSRMGNGEELGP